MRMLWLSFLGRRWIALTESDIFWNTTDTGWVKAAWTLFSAWSNGACIFVHELSKVDAKTILNVRNKSRCWNPYYSLCKCPSTKPSFCNSHTVKPQTTLSQRSSVVKSQGLRLYACTTTPRVEVVRVNHHTKGWGCTCASPCQALEQLSCPGCELDERNT